MKAFAFASALLLLCSSSIPAKTPDLPVIEETAIELWHMSIGSVVIPAVISGKTIYIQPSDVLNFIHVRADFSEDHKKITGYYIDENRKYTIDFQKWRIKYEDWSYDLEKDEYLSISSGNYIRYDIFEKIFKLVCKFDYKNLNIQLISHESLPAELEAQFEKEKSRAGGHQEIKDPDRRFDLSRSLFSLGVLDWAASSSYSKLQKTGGYSFILGGQLLGGDFDASVAGSSYKNIDWPNTPWQYRYSVQNTSLLTQILIGRHASFSNIQLPDTMVGLQVTNAYSGYRTSFTSYTISDRTEPNWAVELFINGAIVGYTKADQTGYFKFVISLPYGSTDVKLRFHGPYGEVRYQTVELKIPYTFLPPGNIEYTLSGGTSFLHPKLKNSMGTLDLKLGVSTAITAGGGVRYKRDEFGKPQYTPYGSTSIKLTNSLLLGGEYYHGAGVRGNLDFTGPIGITAQVGYDHSFAFGKPLATAPPVTGLSGNTLTTLAPDQFTVLEQRKLQIGTPFPFLNGMIRFTALDVPMNKDSGNTTLTGQVAFNIFGLPIDVTANYDYFRERFHLLHGVGTGSAGFSLFPFSAFMLRTSASFDITRRQPLSATFDLTRNIGESLTLHATVLKSFHSKDVSVQASVQIPFSFTRVGVGGSGGTGQDPSVSASAQGAFGYAPTSSEFFSSDLSDVRRGGLEVVPFLDLNGNGKFDEGEPMVKHFALEQPPSRVSEESNGILRIIGLEPYRKYTVKGSTENLENISWVPKFQSFEFISPANGFARVEVPLTVAGQIEGYVYETTIKKDEPLGGIRLKLRRNDAGDTTDVKLTEDLVSYSTGEFFYLGLTPGKYRVYPDPAQLKLIGMQSNPPYVDFELHNKEEGDEVQNLNFTLKTVLESGPSAASRN